MNMHVSKVHLKPFSGIIFTRNAQNQQNVERSINTSGQTNNQKRLKKSQNYLIATLHYQVGTCIHSNNNFCFHWFGPIKICIESQVSTK